MLWLIQKIKSPTINKSDSSMQLTPETIIRVGKNSRSALARCVDITARQQVLPAGDIMQHCAVNVWRVAVQKTDY